jgi:hypothetical protein
MDRSKTTGLNNLANSQEVFSVANHMSIRSIKRTHSGQQNSVWQRSVQRFLLTNWTKVCFASVRHPQSNSLVERANNIILQGIWKRLHGRPKEKMGRRGHLSHMVPQHLWV